MEPSPAALGPLPSGPSRANGGTAFVPQSLRNDFGNNQPSKIPVEQQANLRVALCTVGTASAG